MIKRNEPKKNLAKTKLPPARPSPPRSFGPASSLIFTILLKIFYIVIANPFMGRCCVGKGCGNLITLEIPSTFYAQGLAKSRNDENLLPPCSFSALRNLSGDGKGTGTV
ncbi:hypothetical protein CA2015_3545 [Cyclobacterium amurskyense]|uniref:Uncharacterized protein n=1 Tax=Cyclobacterium amurskyense TaxID=320787 RepID=A0A0H4PIP1_9BACT|nr:hypothetical protein CA2015_3545 [Cyclobacterium amurskyense]